MKVRKEFLKGCTETVALKLLADQPMYGYELMTEIGRRSDGLLEVPHGTVYPLLYAMERKGLITGEWAPKPAKGRRKKYYSLTPKGHVVLREHLAEWARLSQGMARILEQTHAPSR